MKKLAFVLSYFLVTNPGSALENPYSIPVEKFTQELFSGEMTETQINQGLTAALSEVSQLPGIHQAEALIQIRLAAAQALIWLEKKAAAEVLLNQAEKDAKPLLVQPSPGNMALWAEIRSKFLSVKDLGFIITQGGGILEDAEKVLKQEPENLRALFVVAYGKLYQPTFVGGDPQRSRILFEKILNQKPQELSTQFQAWLGLSEAWRKLNAADKRKNSLDQASLIFPKNPGLLTIRKQN